jgi:hypothetical protein
MSECRCGCGRPADHRFRGLAQRCYQLLWREGGLDRYPVLPGLRQGRKPGDGQGRRGGGNYQTGPRPAKEAK